MAVNVVAPETDSHFPVSLVTLRQQLDGRPLLL